MVTEQIRQFQSHFETSQILPTLIRLQSTQQLLSWRRTWKISVSPPAIFFIRSLTVICIILGQSSLMPCRSGTSFSRGLIGSRRWKLKQAANQLQASENRNSRPDHREVRADRRQVPTATPRHLGVDKAKNNASGSQRSLQVHHKGIPACWHTLQLGKYLRTHAWRRC